MKRIGDELRTYILLIGKSTIRNNYKIFFSLHLAEQLNWNLLGIQNFVIKLKKIVIDLCF